MTTAGARCGVDVGGSDLGERSVDGVEATAVGAGIRKALARVQCQIVLYHLKERIK